jgi:hypothetical protein
MILQLPDGVEMEVPIEFMVVKDSVFIPTLKPTELRYLIKRIARELEYTVEMQNAVEDGYLGLMVWRVQ